MLKAGVSVSAALAAEIQEFVKTRLAAHEYLREIEFLNGLPMTSTGKIMRAHCARKRSGKWKRNQPK